MTNRVTLFIRPLGTENYKEITDVDNLDFEKYPDVHSMVGVITQFPIATIAWRVGRQEFLLVNDSNY